MRVPGAGSAPPSLAATRFSREGSAVDPARVGLLTSRPAFFVPDILRPEAWLAVTGLAMRD